MVCRCAPSTTRTPISRASCHHVGHNSVQSHRHQQRSQQAEAQGNEGQHAVYKQDLADLFCQRLDIIDRQIRIQDRAAQLRRERFQVVSHAYIERGLEEAWILPIGEVSEGHDFVAHFSVLAVPDHSHDLDIARHPPIMLKEKMPAYGVAIEELLGQLLVHDGDRGAGGCVSVREIAPADQPNTQGS